MTGFNPPIGEALAPNALDGILGAVLIVNFQRNNSFRKIGEFAFLGAAFAQAKEGGEEGGERALSLVGLSNPALAKRRGHKAASASAWITVISKARSSIALAAMFNRSFKIDRLDRF